jgi:CHAT domain-containing protein
LEQIAAALGADRTSVITGTGASERAVRSAKLADYRVLAFATHGLLPGELRCKSEPALALTPPATPTASDDGLLDASEVAQLKLDADWVLLSACNTASPDGKLGGESLSGLARAFFYAGARSVLASHWAVASRATVALTTGAFDAPARDASLGRAEALRRSALKLAGEKDTAHPFFWAPFVLVGDGGAPAPP